MPTRAATARPLREVKPREMLSFAPYLMPMASTRMRAAMMTLREEVKSTWLSTMLRTPTAEIIPYRTRETPPMVAAGMEAIRAENFGQKDRTMAKHAAMRITRGS